MREPDWVRHAIWWHVYPLGFVGAADPAAGPAHRLSELLKWLDYAVELGASGLALGPIFAATTHGYDTVDHFRIDPRLGDERDFDELVAAAHERGLRILLDGVFNHVGQEFPAFARALEGSAADAAWFRFDGAEYTTFEGHSDLPALNHDNPAVAEYVGDVMCHWLDRGAAGWRLDAAYAVPRPFWDRALQPVRVAHPDAYLVGEVIHGDYAGIVEESGLHSVTQYELWKAIWSSIGDGNFFELEWAMRRHNALLDAFVPMTFVGNHDVTRIASQVVDERHLPHALVVLMTVGGTPAVYYGDEQAFRGVKEDRAGGDDAVRPQFPSDGPAQLAPYGWPTYRLHQDLIGLRRRHPWLHEARARSVHLANEQWLFLAEHDDGRLAVALNLADQPFGCGVEGAREVLAGAADLQGATVTVPPHGWAIIGVGAD
ncbi:alpha-amylase family glycosyl hydrolase [Pseudonocardia sp. TRM90224]|uniref:alpha-amylase family glycosyl hydrolase n=1 Tax=Pseudonocardia sp. TRM90224 TaxID=2812678 RepID=UPI001E2FABB9|nr:alpha-amylase family glycosyl hydrolase [Pseudonocardia sp. TRM90224]